MDLFGKFVMFGIEIALRVKNLQNALLLTTLTKE